MTIYNAVQRVVALVEADSADEALAKLRSALDRAGFEPLMDGSRDNNAFASEPVSPDAKIIR